MKNFNEKYKNFIDSVNLSEEEYREIKSEVTLNKKKKHNYVLKYAVILIMLFISVLGIANADKIIKHYKIITNDNKTFEESHNKSVFFNNRLEKDYSKNILTLNDFYTYDGIEEKLDIKLLKNKYFDSNLFVLSNLEIENNMISKANFKLANMDKVTEYLGLESEFSIIIETNHSNKESEWWFKGGDVLLEKYYIKSLKTEALIFTVGPGRVTTTKIVSFVYDNIMYYLDLRGQDFTDESQKAKLYDFLESFTLND